MTTKTSPSESLWLGFSEEKRKQLRSTSISFLGDSKAIESILDGMEEHTKDLILESIDKRTLANIEDRNYKTIECVLPEIKPYHIGRNVLCYTNDLPKLVDSKIFQSASLDVLMVETENTYWGALTKMAPKASFKGSGKVLSTTDSNARHIILEKSEHFNHICELAENRPAHYIKYCNITGSLFLKESSGNRKQIEKYLIDLPKDLDMSDMCNTIILRKLNKHVVITDRAKSGKSVMLAQIATAIKSMCSGRVVIFIRQSKVPGYIKELSYDNFFQLTASYATKDKFGELILTEMVKKGSIGADVLIDGLDQANQHVYNVFQQLIRSHSNIRFLVTARNSAESDVLNCFGENCIKFCLKPLGKNEQVDLLYLHWKLKLKLDKPKPLLLKFAESCVNAVIKNSQNDRFKSLTDSPLICTMLADAYKAQATCLNTTNVCEQLTERSFIFNIFGKIFCTIFSNSCCLKNILCLYAIKQIFRETPEIEEEQMCEFLEIDSFENFNMQHLLQSFITVEPESLSSSSYSFSHDIFAEFLVAEKIANELSSINPLHILYEMNSKTTVLSYISGMALKTTAFKEEMFPSSIGEECQITTTCFVLPDTCQFMNEFARKNQIKQNNSSTSQWQNTILKTFARSVVASCIKSNLFYLCKLFLSCPVPIYKNMCRQHECSESVPIGTLEIIAAKYSDQNFYEAVKWLVEGVRLHWLVTERQDDRTTFLNQAKYFMTPLHVSSHHGNFEVFMFEASCSQELQTSYLLHVIVQESANDNELLNRRKMEILEELIKKSPGCVHETEPYDDRQPLHMDNIHITFIKRLLPLQINFCAVTKKEKHNFLHKIVCGRYFPASDLRKVMELIPAPHLAKMLKAQDVHRRTPLDAQIIANLNLETVRWLISILGGDEKLLIGHESCSYNGVVNTMLSDGPILSKKWKDLGLKLNIDLHELFTIERDFESGKASITMALTMLLIWWRSSMAKEATMQNLIKLLREMKWDAIADGLREKYLGDEENRLCEMLKNMTLNYDT